MKNDLERLRAEIRAGVPLKIAANGEDFDLVEVRRILRDAIVIWTKMRAARISEGHRVGEIDKILKNLRVDFERCEQRLRRLRKA